jgi:hypothetical protein
MAALLSGGDRIVLLCVHALLVVGPSLAVLALFPETEAEAATAAPVERAAPG